MSAQVGLPAASLPRSVRGEQEKGSPEEPLMARAQLELNSEQEEGETVQQLLIEAPPPKVNPWTKKKNLWPANNALNLSSQDSELHSSTKVIKAGKPKPRKPGKASDFSDITNWPTPSEIANNEYG